MTEPRRIGDRIRRAGDTAGPAGPPTAPATPAGGFSFTFFPNPTPMNVNLIVAAVETAAPHLHFELVRATADGVAFVAPRTANQAEPPTAMLAEHLRLTRPGRRRPTTGPRPA